MNNCVSAIVPVRMRIKYHFATPVLSNTVSAWFMTSGLRIVLTEFWVEFAVIYIRASVLY